jgi:hypothetical protein
MATPTNRRQMSSRWLAWTSTACLIPVLALAQSPALVRTPLDRPGAVEFWPSGGRSPRQVFRLDGRVYAPQLDPTSGKIAMLAADEVAVSGLPRDVRLVVIDTSGRTLSSVSGDVRSFGWCGSDCVAVLRAPPREGAERGIPGRLSLLRPSSGELTGLGTQLNVVDFGYRSTDSALFLMTLEPDGTRPVMKLDLATGAISPTRHRGVRFAPSGLYYMGGEVYGSQADVYDATTDQAVETPPNLGEVVGWTGSEGSVLLYVKAPVLPPIDRSRRATAEERRRIRQAARELAQRPSRYTTYDVAGRRSLGHRDGRRSDWVGPIQIRTIDVSGRPTPVLHR